MIESLVYNTVHMGPATHSVIIGVGDYPHLLGGTGRGYSDHGAMAQLTSPPCSARAFADWLIGEYRNSQCPLSTVTLLISDRDNQTYRAEGRRPIVLKRATLANVAEAIRLWKRRGDAHEGNTIIFYFCGHGVAKGPDTSLLLEDFGSDDDTPLDGAIDLRRLHLGLDKCAARRQIYFIDACRVASSGILDAHEYGGQPIIYGSVGRSKFSTARHAPVFYSTVAGHSAYGRENEPSVYTHALLKALRSAADDAEADGKWRVDTHTLNRGIQFLLERAASRGTDILQINPVDSLSVFTLNELEADPTVPVVVGCRPTTANAVATLSWSDGRSTETRDKPAASDWDVDLTPGDYQFTAVVGADPARHSKKRVRPPFRKVELSVAS